MAETKQIQTLRRGINAQEDQIRTLAILVSALLNCLPEDGPDWDELHRRADKVTPGESPISSDDSDG